MMICNILASNGTVEKSAFLEFMQGFSTFAIPVILFVVLVLAIINKVKVYEVFVDGAKEGFNVAVRIIPYLVAILVAIGMFRASGAMGYLIKILSPVTSLIG